MSVPKGSGTLSKGIEKRSKGIETVFMLSSRSIPLLCTILKLSLLV
jgi:hypothetical protein